EAVGPDVARRSHVPIDLEERSPQDPHADERARLAEIEAGEVALFVAGRNIAGHAVGEAEGDAVVRARGIAERRVQKLVEHAAEEATIDALAEAHRHAAVARVVLLLRLAPERVAVKLVDRHVAPSAK